MKRQVVYVVVVAGLLLLLLHHHLVVMDVFSWPEEDWEDSNFTLWPYTTAGGWRSQNVLILSSSGRSGSSFLGELLASQCGNIYFFEPERTLEMDEITAEAGRVEIERNFLCQMREELLESRFGSSTIRLSSPLRCNYERWVKQDLVRAKRICERNDLRIMKTVRVRLEWVLVLLEKEELNLKVVHLVRDPRGSLLSKKSHWPSDEDDCENITKDLHHQEEVKRRFPTKYFFLRYEDLCRQPEAQTRELLQFLGGSGGDRCLPDEGVPGSDGATLRSGLPTCVAHFLQTHTRYRRTWLEMFSTYRDSSNVYQRWRKSITQEMLSEIEGRCRYVIQPLWYCGPRQKPHHSAHRHPTTLTLLTT